MELTWRHLLYFVLAVVILIGMYLVLFRPAPDVEAGCNFGCTDTIVDTEMIDNLIASEICGSGHDVCCIEKIEYHIAGWKVYCTCCDCTEGGVTTDLGECAYGFGLNWLGAMMGLCEISGG